ncbi:MAG: MOSC domain-containing protein [Gammaproteobacteria bacterium]|nr:MAG: MOSC domain-containing protein [Gammaproteobacteria bacterium]
MKVTEINIYPIKSTRRIGLTESEVLPRGLPWDRRWMLVDDEGKFMTARQHPILAVVETCFAGNVMQVNVADRPTLQLSLQPPAGETMAVTVWKDQCDALLAGEEADAWFSEYLGVSCRLVQMTDELVRGVNPNFGRPGDEVSFADGFPLLLLSEASLHDLNSRLDEAVSMRRFRPNLVVDGEQPYAEDNWQRLRVGEVEFAGVKNCSRCVFTTIDPDTGVKHPGKEPLRTLSSYRRRPEGGVYFGQNLIPRSGGIIRVGDAVEILG